MNRAELIELVANGESSTLEFKRDDVRAERLAREAVAMANLQGGRILLGVEDDGAIPGIRRERLEEWVMDAVFGRTVHPLILPLYEEVALDANRRVAVVTVGAGVSKPYVVRSRGREDIYVRVGSTTRLATREQTARLFAQGGLIHTELLPVSGSGIGELSLERLTDYIGAVVGDEDVPRGDDEWHDRLCALGFMAEGDGGLPVCTVAGLVLFGYRPRRLLRQSGVRWLCFSGSDKDYEALDDRTFEGPLVALWKRLGGARKQVEPGVIERLTDAMRPFVTTDDPAVNDQMRRELRWHYPAEALREGIVNAFAHRDWTRNETVEVSRYGDRLEIVSPGAMANGMTIGKMLAGRRVPRNVLISEVLRDYRYADARGMGVRYKIVRLMRTQNGVDPEFEATEDYLGLTLRRTASTLSRSC